MGQHQNNIGSRCTYYGIRPSTGASTTCLYSVQIIEQAADKVMMKKPARLWVVHHQGENRHSGSSVTAQDVQVGVATPSFKCQAVILGKILIESDIFGRRLHYNDMWV